MTALRSRFVLASVFAALSACGVAAHQDKSSVKIRPVTKAEAEADLNQIIDSVRSLYGPLEFKERRFGYKFEDLVTKAKAELAAAQTEEQTLGVFKKFVTNFKDGHVGLRFPVNGSGANKHSIPVEIVPVEGKAIVEKVDASLASLGIAVGDELLTVDGVTPQSLLPTIKQYDSLGNDTSDEFLIANVLSRPFYISELKPKSDDAVLKFQRADGSTYERKILWRVNAPAANATEFVTSKYSYRDGFKLDNVDGLGFSTFGARAPFFLNDTTKKTYGFLEVTANAESLKKFGLTDEEGKKIYSDFIFSAMYNFKGKNVLLVRIPSYTPPFDQVKVVSAYKALLSQHERFVDVLVIDQNHNPGGSLFFVTSLFQIFITKEQNNLVQFMHADRRWLSNIGGALESGENTEELLRGKWLYKLIEKSYDEGKSLTSPIPLFAGEMVAPDKDYQWKKPVLVLHDEMAGSCGDIFPMLMKRNNVAKTFGKRTMGLGGNVEPVAQLSYSNGQLRLTRGLFTTYRPDGAYTDADLVENNGIEPTIGYSHTVEDFRKGYQKYVESFSEAAIAP